MIVASYLIILIPTTEAAKEQKRKDRGARESKTITVETYASVLTGPNTDTGILPTSSRRSPPKSSTSEDSDTISFFCGNPLVEVTKGVLHLYKEKLVFIICYNICSVLNEMFTNFNIFWFYLRYTYFVVTF